VITLKAVVTVREADLIQTIRRLAYGEIYGVEIEDGLRLIDVDVSECEHSLIDLIRDGQHDISVLHVHQSQPALAELDFVEKGFRCRKKIKFPTV
jgi:hypothetical protein